MKWVTKDIQSNKKIWYSEDVIKRIRDKANEFLSLPYAISCVVPLQQILFIIDGVEQ